MSSLTWRISRRDETENDPEDYFGSSLGVIFPDDVTNLHGDADHGLIYTSPHLPRPLEIDLADPVGDDERRLFSHYLWNASLQLAELIEADTLGVPLDQPRAGDGPSFSVRGLDILELGAGTALPSIMAGLLGANRVVVTDYPAESVLETLRANIARGIRPELSPLGSVPSVPPLVEGHAWGELTDAFSLAHRQAFDRVVVADCLWMPWQHANLHRSIAFFLRDTPVARCWVVAGFHTGREKLLGFFDAAALALAGLELEHIWERECNGEERPWTTNHVETISTRKRWLVIASLKKKKKKKQTVQDGHEELRDQRKPPEA